MSSTAPHVIETGPEQDRAGNRVIRTWNRPAPEVLDRFRQLSVPSIADALLGHGVLSPTIRILTPLGATVVGSALPVTITPGNGLMIRRAIEIAEPGDILIVNGYGTRERAVLGGNVLITAKVAGIAAVVVDGAVRDIDDAQRLKIPVAAVALTPRSGTDPNGTGEVGCTAAVGSVPVAAGDIVALDADGIVVVGSRDAEAVVTAAEEVQQRKGSSHDFEERLARVRDSARHTNNQ